MSTLNDSKTISRKQILDALYMLRNRGGDIEMAFQQDPLALLKQIEDIADLAIKLIMRHATLESECRLGLMCNNPEGVLRMLQRTDMLDIEVKPVVRTSETEGQWVELQ